MDNKSLDMTHGSPVRHLIVFAIPMLIGNLFQQVYNLADSIIVGQLVGSDALAAIGVTGSITFLFFALCNGIASGGSIISSQYFGSGDKASVKSCIANTGYIMFFFPLVVGVIAFLLAPPLLRLLDTPAAIWDDSLVYTRIMCVGLLFVSLYNFVSAMLRSLGDSKTPLYFLIFSCLLNVVLDILFVTVFHAGVAGAGYATVISQFVSGISCMIYAVKTNSYFRITREEMAINPLVISKTLKLGIPMSLQFSLIAISCMALQKVVNSYGAVAVAAFTATSRIEQLIHMPYQTLGSSLSTYCGQNYGANKHDRVLLGYRKSMIMMTILTIIMLPFMQLFGQAITSLFVKDADVIIMGGKALQISSWFYIFLGVIYMVRGILNGVGDALFALINGIVEVIGRFTVPLLMTSVLGYGVWGIWISVGIVWFISGATAYIRYLKYYRYAKKKISEAA